MKKFFAAVTALSLILALGACGKQEEPPVAAETTMETSMDAQQNQESTFTGTLEEKKDFMIVVVGDDGNAYTFNLDGVAVPAEPSQRVTVTYTGDLTDFDAQLMATKVELAKN